MSIEKQTEFVLYLSDLGISEGTARDIVSNVKRIIETFGAELKLEDLTDDEKVRNILASIERLNPSQFSRWQRSLRRYQSFAFDQLQKSGSSMGNESSNREQEEIDDIIDQKINSDGIESLDNWDSAENLVLQYERQKGWQAKMVTSRGAFNALGYDIESISPMGDLKHIEVKSKKAKKFAWLQLTANETKAFLEDPCFCLYLVEGDCINNPDSVSIAEVSRNELLQMVIMKMEARFSRLSTIPRKKAIVPLELAM